MNKTESETLKTFNVELNLTNEALKAIHSIGGFSDDYNNSFFDHLESRNFKGVDGNNSIGSKTGDPMGFSSDINNILNVALLDILKRKV